MRSSGGETRFLHGRIDPIRSDRSLVDRAGVDRVGDCICDRSRSTDGSPLSTTFDPIWIQVDTKVILVGGMRTTETMEDVIESGDADFVAMARPFIREPDIARQILEGRTGRVDCTSCNICLMHEGHHSLRCWRKPRRRLLQHALYRFSGGFKRDRIIKTH